MNENLKCCVICGEVKSFREYSINRLNGTRSSVCRDCEKKLKQELANAKTDGRSDISPKVASLIYDMRHRLKDLGVSTTDIVERVTPAVSGTTTRAILSGKTINNEPKLSALETICDALDLELMLYAIPRTTPHYKVEAAPTPIDDSLSQKECASCGNMLPITSFSFNRNEKDGYSRYCKECMREKYYKRNKEE